MNMPNFFAVIPAFVRYDKKLSCLEKLLYAEISALANKEGYCFAKNSYFAEVYELSERQVSRSIGHLAALGFIDVVIENGNERKIYIAAFNGNMQAEKAAEDDEGENETTLDEEASESVSDGESIDENGYPDKNVMGAGQKCLSLKDSTSKEVRVNNNINNKYNIYLAVLKFLNETLGTAYKPCEKNKKLISARINEGYALSDFQKVIKDRFKLWGKDVTMCRYLRPETLFGSKFSGYLETAKLAESSTGEGKAAPKDTEADETKRLIDERIRRMEERKKAASLNNAECRVQNAE